MRLFDPSLSLSSSSLSSKGFVASSSSLLSIRSISSLKDYLGPLHVHTLSFRLVMRFWSFSFPLPIESISSSSSFKALNPTSAICLTFAVGECVSDLSWGRYGVSVTIAPSSSAMRCLRALISAFLRSISSSFSPIVS